MKITGSQFECPNCRRHFGGSHAYGLHFRDGECKTVAEMLAAGLRLNVAGFWSKTLALPRKQPISSQGSAP